MFKRRATMQSDIVNTKLDELIQRDSPLPNRTSMDLFKLRRDVYLYAISIEGDSYIRGPYFYEATDAILHALNPKYMIDSIGFATNAIPANTKHSEKFVFNSMLRLMEYKIDSDTMYYNSEKKTRPDCQNIGAGNFKVDFNLVLFEGNNSDFVGYQVTGQPQDVILENIVSKKSNAKAVDILAFMLCSPGKTLRLEKSYRIDMALLWTFYATMLSRGRTPRKLRDEDLYGPNGKQAVYRLLSDSQVPSAIGDLPKNISTSIAKGSNLDALLRECSTTALGLKVCVSSSFFKSLYERDVKPITNYYSAKAFDREDKAYLFPFGSDIAPTSPYIDAWLYREDYMPDMGRGDIAYDWNYNRFLDVNTAIYWSIAKLQKFMKLTDTKVYSVSTHKSKIQHRFSDPDIESFEKMTIYEVSGDNKIEFIVDNKGLIIHVKSLSSRDRAGIMKTRILEFIDSNLFKSSRALYDKFNLNKGFDAGTRIIGFLPQLRTISDLPINWYLLQLFSTIMRYCITNLEFSFFVWS